MKIINLKRSKFKIIIFFSFRVKHFQQQLNMNKTTSIYINQKLIRRHYIA